MMWRLVGSAAAVGIGCLIVSNFASAGLARAMTPVQRRLQVLMTRDCVPDDVPDCMFVDPILLHRCARATECI